MDAGFRRSHSPIHMDTSQASPPQIQQSDRIKLISELEERQKALEAKAAEIERREQAARAQDRIAKNSPGETSRPISSYCIKGIKVIALIIVFPIVQLGTGFIFTVKFGGSAAKYIYQKLSGRDAPKACAAILAGVATIPGGICGLGFGIFIASFVVEHQLIKTVLNDRSLCRAIREIGSTATDW